MIIVNVVPMTRNAGDLLCGMNALLPVADNAGGPGLVTFEAWVLCQDPAGKAPRNS